MNGSQRLPGRDHRGGSADRRRRRAYLLVKFAVDGGTVCHRCGVWIAATTRWHVDRWPISGARGGRYVRGNIMPSCPDCNVRHLPVRARRRAVELAA